MDKPTKFCLAKPRLVLMHCHLMHSVLCLGFIFENNIDMSSTFNVGNVDIILQKSFILKICYGKIYFLKNL